MLPQFRKQLQNMGAVSWIRFIINNMDQKYAAKFYALRHRPCAIDGVCAHITGEYKTATIRKLEKEI